MKPRRSHLRLASILALGLGLAAFACEKSGEGTDKPGGGNGPIVETDGKPPALGGKEYVYAAEGFTLNATMEIKFEISSGQGSGVAEMAARSLIEATWAGEDKLQIHGKVLELIKYEGSGQMDPEFMKKQAIEQGAEPTDIVEELKTSESWLVIDLKGDLDKDATKALAENQADDESQDFGLFNLPDLPSVDLVEGEKVALPTREDTRTFPFGELPVEIDETWTLRKIDANRIAEFDVTSEVSGATEISGGQGTALISTLEESSFTVLFNLETKLPVSITGYSQSETSIDAQGQNITFSINNDLTGTYEPAGGEPTGG
jgi:hypothetical protein